MTGGNTVRLAVFVSRCTAAATIAYLSASAIGLPHPLWTCIFALVGSQDSESAIFTAIGGRVAGTIIGVVVAVTVGTAMHRLGLDPVWQIACRCGLRHVRLGSPRNTTLYVDPSHHLADNVSHRIPGQ